MSRWLGEKNPDLRVSDFPYLTHLTTLRYDAFDRVIQLTTTQTATSTVIEDKAFVWCGMSICQERDGSPTATPSPSFGITARQV